MNADREYSTDGGLVIVTMMLVSIVSALLGCLLTLGVQWLMRVMGY